MAQYMAPTPGRLDIGLINVPAATDTALTSAPQILGQSGREFRSRSRTTPWLNTMPRRGNISTKSRKLSL
jgi:hypothetical protein